MNYKSSTLYIDIIKQYLQSNGVEFTKFNRSLPSSMQIGDYSFGKIDLNLSLADPFIIYRSSQRKFSASSFGGSYVNSNGAVIGGDSDEPTKLLEWNLVQFNLTMP